MRLWMTFVLWCRTTWRSRRRGTRVGTNGGVDRSDSEHCGCPSRKSAAGERLVPGAEYGVLSGEG